MNKGSLILFDGVCNLCNGAVQFIIKRDKAAYFRFASLQSAEGQRQLQEHQLSAVDFNSFVLIEDNVAYTRSTAALRISRRLPGLWPLLYCFMIVPRFIRDGVYDIISRNRYKWFGKKESCVVPSAELKARFLN